MEIEASGEPDRESKLEQPRVAGEPLDFVLSEASATSSPFRRSGPSPEHALHPPLSERLANISSRLATQIWTTDCFTTTLSEWLRRPVRYVSTLHEIGPVTEGSATRLGIEPGSPVIYRRGHLVMAGHGEQHVVAEVRAVVAHDSLDPEERLALESRAVALGHLLRRRGVRRHTRAVTPASGNDGTGRRLLKIAATLVVADNPVAVVDEMVYDNALTLSRHLSCKEAFRRHAESFPHRA
ncbi:hypothetical protein [Amycolatopsis speibonae]|uniref:UTRA domain-containing protein n=1 Tax=Amycolatopsis speibonae TaxID=1450224 RepID=A0ABV7PAG2_9PSEU